MGNLRYVAPLAESHKDIEKWLEKERKPEKMASMAKLEELENARVDEAGKFMYEA